MATIEQLLSGDYTSPEDASAGLDFAGYTFAGLNPGTNTPLFFDAAGNLWEPDTAAGYNFAGYNFAGAMPQLKRPPMRPVQRPSPQQQYQQQLQQELIRKAAMAQAQTTPVTVPGAQGQTARTSFAFDSSAVVNAGASTTINVQPQMPMKIDRLSTSNTSFLIDDFKIGVKSQFAAVGSLPSEAFAPNAVRNDVTFDPILNGYIASLRVTNVGSSAARFNMAVFGEVIRS